eukprot:XP_765943.1 hypothetical protein [Theileria parva strain Muguga]
MLMSLWLRCKTEYNRTKTIERATMQLNNILKSYYDDGNRNEYFFQISYPAIWNIKREIGKFQL